MGATAAEIEELYRVCPFIKELSVVGVPDGTAEHVACAVVPDLEHDPKLSRAEVQTKIEEHFRTVSSGLPFWKRVKTLELWEGELPKTAKRSIKRREVVAELQRRARRLEPEAEGPVRVAWFLDAVPGSMGPAHVPMMPLTASIPLIASDSNQSFNRSVMLIENKRVTSATPRTPSLRTFHAVFAVSIRSPSAIEPALGGLWSSSGPRMSATPCSQSSHSGIASASFLENCAIESYERSASSV